MHKSGDKGNNRSGHGNSDPTTINNMKIKQATTNQDTMKVNQSSAAQKPSLSKNSQPININATINNIL